MKADGENTFKSINNATLQLDIVSQSTARRCSVAPRLLEDCAVLSSTGRPSLAFDARLKGIMFANIDNCVVEQQARFSEKNIAYLKSMLSLWTPSNDFVEFESVSPLANLMQFSQNDKGAFQQEC